VGWEGGYYTCPVLRDQQRIHRRDVTIAVNISVLVTNRRRANASDIAENVEQIGATTRDRRSDSDAEFVM
jgi:hypothetical protein